VTRVANESIEQLDRLASGQFSSDQFMCAANKPSVSGKSGVESENGNVAHPPFQYLQQQDETVCEFYALQT